LARALAPRPKLILLDEPFSALDVDLRERLSQDVRAILQHEGTTALLVTHSQFEAFAMADWIGVMCDGRLQQWDTPYNLYHQPNGRFVADFVGEGRLLPGRRRADGAIETELGTWPARNGLRADAGVVEVLLRPDDVVHDDASPVTAEVRARAFRGAEFLYTLRLASGREVLSLVPSHHDHAIGCRIGIRLDVEHVIAFPQS
jgi:iron(III) transport system ATP-binding protein